MARNVLAIVGSYRKGGMIDQMTDAVLGELAKRGDRTGKIYLLDKHIEFCLNCRKCASADPSKSRGECVIKDDMEELLLKIDASDSLILAAPINFGGVTAIMKRFIERLIVYGYWPWGTALPKYRKKSRKTAMTITASACPSIVGRFLMPGATQTMKAAAAISGAKVVKSTHLGMASMDEKQKLGGRRLSYLRAAAKKL
jgi:multimeric flavodoxin WrbA